MPLQLERANEGTLADVIDRILDKGLVINADIAVSVVGIELLSIKIRAALASFETAAKYGLEFPSGTRLPELAGAVGAPPAGAYQAQARLAHNGVSHAPIPH